jgi:hypothetical protein
MNMRDVKPSTLKRLAAECEKEFEEWFNLTDAKQFNTKEPIHPRDIWRTAYSKGASAVLRRVEDKLKDV